MKLSRHLKKLGSDLTKIQSTKLKINNQLEQIDSKISTLMNQSPPCPHLLNARYQEMQEIHRLREMSKQYRDMYIQKSHEEERLRHKISHIEEKCRLMDIKLEKEKESNELDELIRLSAIYRKRDS